MRPRIWLAGLSALSLTGCCYGLLPSRSEPAEAPAQPAWQPEHLEPGAHYGAVRLPDGGPAPGAEVHVVPYGGQGTETVVRTDAQGHYLATGLAEGTCAFNAELGSLGGTPASGPVEVSRAGGRVDIALSEGRAASGRVVDQVTGQPIAGAQVDTFDHGYHHDQIRFREPYVARTDAEGRFRLAGLREAEGVTAQAPGYVLGQQRFARRDGPAELTLPLLRDPGPQPSEEAWPPISLEDDAQGVRVTSQPSQDPFAEAGVVHQDVVLAIDGVAVGPLGPRAAIELLRRGRGRAVKLRLAGQGGKPEREVKVSLPPAPR